MNVCKCVQDGKTTKFGYNDRMWCCKTTEDQCKGDRYNTSMTCNGTALSLSDQCHGENYGGPFCNYYPMDVDRNGHSSYYAPRSYLDLCQDNRYVQHDKAVSTKKIKKNVFSSVLVLMKPYCAKEFHCAKTKMI